MHAQWQRKISKRATHVLHHILRPKLYYVSEGQLSLVALRQQVASHIGKEGNRGD